MLDSRRQIDGQGNDVLARLPDAALRGLTRYCSTASFAAGDVVQETGADIDKLLFPVSGVASLHWC
jgi:hypothetical protein